MAMLAVWHGTNRERDILLAAIARNCACPINVDESSTPPCEAHKMLTDPCAQQILDRLLFTYRIRDKLVTEEWQG